MQHVLFRNRIPDSFSGSMLLPSDDDTQPKKLHHLERGRE